MQACKAGPKGVIVISAQANLCNKLSAKRGRRQNTDKAEALKADAGL
jgi:hypothetical protein